MMNMNIIHAHIVRSASKSYEFPQRWDKWKMYPTYINVFLGSMLHEIDHSGYFGFSDQTKRSILCSAGLMKYALSIMK